MLLSAYKITYGQVMQYTNNTRACPAEDWYRENAQNARGKNTFAESQIAAKLSKAFGK